ncbi:MAG TPA: PHP domain-containing protein [Syntrophomonadaceae bacterium]|jgi:putative hydrolase|nr:PHP domain-containing protein [Syntrophomonadaceae bacterium]
MDFFGDYHTHSRHSDGRQSDLQIIEAARSRGLKEVAITDHGPLVLGIGIKDAGTLKNMRLRIDAFSSFFPDIDILLGVEANIRDLDGHLDINVTDMEPLDIIIAGLHPYTLPTSLSHGIHLNGQNFFRHLSRRQRQKAVAANTQATVAALDNNPQLDILSHPGLFFHVDIAEVAKACARNQVLFEINCGHGYPPISDIMIAKEQGVTFIINSDAHFQETVGQLDYGRTVIEQLGIPEERIVNLQEQGGYKRWSKKVKGCIH